MRTLRESLSVRMSMCSSHADSDRVSRSGCRGAPPMRTLTESLGQDVEVLLSCGL